VFQSAVRRFLVSDADNFIHLREENFPSPILPVAALLDDRVYHRIDKLVFQH